MIVTIITLIFLYAPLVVVSIASFNNSKYGGAWRGFSFRWYEKLFTDTAIWEALVNTLVVALIATFFSTLLGTLAALALYKGKGKLQVFHYALVYSPLVVPDILMGISLLLLFVTTIGIGAKIGLSLELGMTTIIIAHVTFCLSYVTMVVLGRLQDFDHSLIEAAQDLGANALQIFFKVTLPIIAPAIIAGALFAFTLSIDDFVVTFFVRGNSFATLSTVIYTITKRKIPLSINALCAIMFITVLVILIVVNILGGSNKKEDKR